MELEGRKVCITGAAGFIGSHLAERLLGLGAHVVGVDNFNDFYDPAIKRANVGPALAQGGTRYELLEGEIRDPGLIGRAVAGCDVVIHLAAMAGVRPSLAQPALYAEVNVSGTLQVLQACRTAGVGALVFASSSSVYGNNRKAPFAEADPVDNPISVYAATKKAGELLCHTYHAVWGLDVTCLRFFTVFGPRQRPDLAIHKFSRLIEAGEPIPVFGDGSMERDHTYIEDILDGVVAAAQSAKGAGYRVINLGSDRPVRLDRLIAAIEAALGREARIDRRPVPPGDVVRTWADLTEARRLLDYAPRTPLEQGLAHFVTWLRQGG
jgi:UDP-glucuronate 4-epimerase